MQSPCLNEVSEVCFHDCCPSPLSFPSGQTGAAKRLSTSAESRREFAAKTSSSIFPRTHFTNHESIPSLQDSFSVFIHAYPNYHKTRPVDKIRAKEYSNLSTSNMTCLDYTGIGLFSFTQLQKQDSSISQIASLPSSSSLCDHFPSPPRNLHFPFFSISNKTGDLKTQLLYEGHESELESGMKKRIFRFLNISENEYSIVFTANRTSAFKLLAESYPFKSSSKLLTVYDYESEAVEAMLSSSEKRGAKAMSAEFSWPRLRIRSAKMWMSIAQENRWHILIDACTIGPKEMDSFGLSLIQPDFLVCSFYKIFGENPSGFGCLFVKKSTIQVLEASSSSAGIVNLVRPEKLIQFAGESSSSDIEQGLISTALRARCLINWLVSSMTKLKHPNEDGDSLIRIYGPKIKFDRGPALAFNVFDWKGEKVEPVLVQKLADRNNISLSYGFLHHIWFSDKHAGEKGRFLERRTNGRKEPETEKKKAKSGMGITVVTAALGFLTNFEDAYKLWAFIARFLDADFVEKERWRYTALNQKIIEV